MSLKEKDPLIWAYIQKEKERQENTIELIASENFTSKEVMEAMGTILTNKYAEGYPKKRYYGGCENVDAIEQLAIDRVKKLFGAEYANVQPHSGAQANMAAYQAILQPGDTVIGMSLENGGQLTHGSPVNQSGKLYNFVPYGVKEDGRINYDELRQLIFEYKPRLVLAGASAYPRIIDFKAIRESVDAYNESIGISTEPKVLSDEDIKYIEKHKCYFMVDMAHIAGLVAAGLHPSPVPYADIVTSTTHKTLRGPRGGIILAKSELGKKLNSAVFPGTQGGPLEHVIAAKAVCFEEALQPEFKLYQRQIVENCKVLAEGLVACGFNLVSGGTDNHLMLVDVKSLLGITGKEAETILDQIHITVNKNTIPNETESPFKTSGIRLGTPAMTTRGLKEAEFVSIGHIIAKALKNRDDKEVLKGLEQEVLDLTSRFPIYE